MVSQAPKKISSFSKIEIARLFKEATVKVRYPGVRILAGPLFPGQLYAKLLMVVSRRVGNAPQRNLIKRRLRAIFKEERLFLGMYNLTIIVDNRVIALPFTHLKALMLKAQKFFAS